MSGQPFLLVVDDDEDIREVLAVLLNSEGYTVAEAFDGQHALDTIRSQGKPALVLVDLRMPRMNGFEFVKALRADPPNADIPVVVISGDWRAEQGARELSVAGFLQKPLNADDVIRKVRSFHIPASSEARPA
jgi:CheY-like chemotaxis protein